MNGTVEIIDGTKGSGKTSMAAEMGIEHLAAGGWWYTNVEVFADRIREWMAARGLLFDPSRLVLMRGNYRDFYEHVGRGTAEQAVLVTVDEAALEWDSRDFRDTAKEQNSFNALCRKLDIRLIYICQDALDLDKKFRRQCDVLWHCRDMRKLHIGPIPLPLPFFIRVPWYFGLSSKPTRGGMVVCWRSWAWGMFDSDALLGPQARYFAKLKTHKCIPLQKIPREWNRYSWGQRVTLPWRLFDLIGTAALWVWLFGL